MGTSPWRLLVPAVPLPTVWKVVYMPLMLFFVRIVLRSFEPIR